MTKHKKVDFKKYLIVPITDLFLKGGEYKKVTSILEHYEQSQLLQNGVQSVLLEDPALFQGVDFIIQPQGLPGFVSENEKNSTSIAQRSHFPAKDPNFWHICTVAEGKDFGGLRPYKKSEEYDPNYNGGFVTTTSLNLALRLANAAYKGNKDVYKYTLYLIVNSNNAPIP